MVDYYGRLLAGQPRADALRQAQLAMLRNPGADHPFYWAGFISSGAWDPLQATTRDDDLATTEAIR